MITAFVVPHAPLLVDIPGRPHPAPEFVAAMAELDVGDEAIVLTPHGPGTGLMHATTGDLAGFGLPHRVAIQNDGEFAAAVTSAWGRPVIEDPVDHGAVVPLLLLPTIRSAVICSLPEWTGQNDGDSVPAIDAGRALGEALVELSERRDLTVICSAHTSAAVTDRAPLPECPEGRTLDDNVVAAVGTAPALLNEIAPETWRRAGACGAGPLVALATMCGGRPLEIVHRGAPFGVGYLVARSR